MYPSLVNCTTIDLFADWPQDALLEVGERYLSQIELAGDEKVNRFLIKFLCNLIFRNNYFQFETVRTVVIVFYFTLSLLSFFLSLCMEVFFSFV